MSASRLARVQPEASVVPLQTAPSRAVAGRLLGEELRRWRESRGLTLKDVAPVIRGSTSKISRLERGESPPKPRDVLDLARHYGLGQEEMQLVERLLEQAQDCEWYEQFSDVTPTYLRRLIQLEGSAQKICTFENQVVPGLLQTREYAREIVRLVMPGASEDEIDRVVELRIRRQLILADGIPRLTALLDVSILYRRRGSDLVMREQMEHLLRAAGTAKVNVRVIKLESVTPPHPITHLVFPEGGPSELAYVELIRSANYVTRTKTLDDYRKILTHLRDVAASMEESRDIIVEAAERYR
ncbi:hypothetical protein A6A06_14825 [Streptomyces sp. CB02923]|nr:helix-turn-helix transcriptional regulator [Streptomyces sp. CB02923]OKI02323.1 hypothetical protein A6A06_14825 [Streptomyces sp. CB02923]